MQSAESRRLSKTLGPSVVRCPRTRHGLVGHVKDRRSITRELQVTCKTDGHRRLLSSSVRFSLCF
jgi:hypothetical protein